MNIKRFLSGALCAVLLLALCPAAAADAPCEISSAEELSLLRETPDGDFVLTADIDMTGVDWQPIAFSGTLDGGGHTIYNLTISSLGADRAHGLFLRAQRRFGPRSFAARRKHRRGDAGECVRRNARGLCFA